MEKIKQHFEIYFFIQVTYLNIVAIPFFTKCIREFLLGNGIIFVFNTQLNCIARI